LVNEKCYFSTVAILQSPVCCSRTGYYQYYINLCYDNCRYVRDDVVSLDEPLINNTATCDTSIGHVQVTYNISNGYNISRFHITFSFGLFEFFEPIIIASNARWSRLRRTRSQHLRPYLVNVFIFLCINFYFTTMSKTALSVDTISTVIWY